MPKNPKMKGKRRLEFTVAELLIFIATMLPLSATLFPIFETAREKGRQAARRSNLKMIGPGLIQMSRTTSSIRPGLGTARKNWLRHNSC